MPSISFEGLCVLDPGICLELFIWLLYILWFTILEDGSNGGEGREP